MRTIKSIHAVFSTLAVIVLAVGPVPAAATVTLVSSSDNGISVNAYNQVEGVGQDADDPIIGLE